MAARSNVSDATPSGGDFTLPGSSGKAAAGCFVTRRQWALVGVAILVVAVVAAAFGRYVWAPAERPDLTEEDALEDGDGGGDGPYPRLPRDVLPVRYRLHLWPVLDQVPPNRTKFTFEGRLALSVRVVAEGGAVRIPFHVGANLTVSEAHVVVTEASAFADELADSWETFPGAEPRTAEGGRALRAPPRHSRNPERDRNPAGNKTLRRIVVTEVRRTPQWDLVEVRTEEKLVWNSTYTVFLWFNSTIRNDTQVGLYLSSYKDDKTNTTRWLTFSLMEPTFARGVFPCMDEPNFRAPFEVSIARINGTKALSNAPFKTSTTIPVPGWHWDHFRESVPMPTYLVAFAITDFSYITPSKRRAMAVSSSVKEIEVRLWAQDYFLRRGKYAVDMINPLLDYFETYFAMPYAGDKIDIFAAPNVDDGGMENWGLIIFKDDYLLVDVETAEVDDIETAAQITAHEMSHMWLGNLVTAGWWDELWLNEGFAAYFQVLAAHHLEPGWDLEARFQISILGLMLLLDAEPSSRPVVAEVRSKKAASDMFTESTYLKGACLVRMLNHALGDDVFQRGMRLYMKARQHNTTTESYLWQSLTEAVEQTPSAAPWHQRLPGGTPMARVMSSWLRTSGFPAVSVTRSDGKILFTQERFRSRAWQRNCTRPASGPERWHVPLSMATRSEAAEDAAVLNDTRPRAWLVNRTLELDDPANDTDWVVVNMHQTGFFRVNYDLPNWRLLSDQLRDDPSVLPVGVRVQLLSDAFALAQSGLLPFPVALNLTVYLPGWERHPRAWLTALLGLSFIDDKIAGHVDEALFQRFMRRLLSPAWDQVVLGVPTTATRPPRVTRLSHEALLLRDSVVRWGCEARLDKCEDWARRAVDLWRRQDDPDKNNATIWVPKTLRKYVYCTAVTTGSSDVWDFMWERYLAEREEKRPQNSHQSNILEALACSREPARLEDLLGRTLSDCDMRRKDVATLWEAVAKAPVGRVLVLPYLREHWPEIHEAFWSSKETIRSILAVVSATASTKSAMEDVKAFQSEISNSLDDKSNILNDIEAGIRHKSRWMNKYWPAIKGWLEFSVRFPLTFP